MIFIVEFISGIYKFVQAQNSISLGVVKVPMALGRKSKVLHWRDVTPNMVKKYKAFNKRFMEEYSYKINKSDRVFVHQNEK